jgi:hypothetical protein
MQSTTVYICTYVRTSRAALCGRVVYSAHHKRHTSTEYGWARLGQRPQLAEL